MIHHRINQERKQHSHLRSLEEQVLTLNLQGILTCLAFDTQWSRYLEGERMTSVSNKRGGKSLHQRQTMTDYGNDMTLHRKSFQKHKETHLAQQKDLFLREESSSSFFHCLCVGRKRDNVDNKKHNIRLGYLDLKRQLGDDLLPSHELMTRIYDL